ncbi:MAG: HAMP domain-containing protein [Chloroflexota bacterium]|nr:MAG: HAMP domain-containing protein [Chloroflexota bacterium]
MHVEPWGAAGAPYIALPERTAGLAVLAIYVLILLGIVYVRRRDFREFGSRRWLLVLGLVAASFLFSQGFLISLTSESQLPPLSSAQNPVETVAPFGLVPILLAGAAINPLAALLAGLAGGLGRALWQTHQVTDPFQLAFAGVLAATLMQQNYSGWLYAWLRQPIISSLFAAILLLPLIGLSTLVYANASATVLEALDLAISTTRAYLWPLLFVAVLDGVIVTLLLFGLPQLKRQRHERGSPFSDSLNIRLVATFLVFAAPLSILLFFFGFNVALKLATDLAIDQMARDAQAASAMIPAFLNSRQHLLVEATGDEALLTDDGERQKERLLQLFRAGDIFRTLILVDQNKSIKAHHPDDDVSSSLTRLESRELDNLSGAGAPYISPAQVGEDGQLFFSFIIPIAPDANGPESALVGRVPGFSLEELVASLQGTLGQGVGFVLDEESKIVGHPNAASVLKPWAVPTGDARKIDTDDQALGEAYVGLQASTNARQLVYHQTGPDHPWTVVITVPHEAILDQALQIAGRLEIVLVVALLVFGLFLILLGRSVTQPLTDLAQASQEIASGSLNTSIATHGDDEIGRLSEAFGQMQISLKRRLDELSLLLDVSQDVSKSIDLSHGMPSVLKGALRGTGAAGARVIVVNQGGRKPLTFGEGPASAEMVRYDEQVMRLLKEHEELILSTPEQTATVIKNGIGPQVQPSALIAFPLVSKRRFQGIFWLSYRQAHVFDQTEIGFLRTLSSQASVLVENARLYATAEGGRRRLAAVLASTSDAVIVTDQGHRVLLVNPAMERYFGLSTADVIGRPVGDVISSEPLVKALALASEKTSNLEVPIDEGKILVASASTIYSNDGDAIGRVAVLHDITYLKELDDMKSDFVATVSHDLRSPLTFMLGYATMLSMVGDLEPKQEEYVGKILGGIDQMSALVEALLDLGRLDAGIELTLIRLRMEEIIESIVEEYRQPAAAAGLTLVSEIAGNLPPVCGDAALTRQAVANYVSNAIKYAPDSGRLVVRAVAGKDEVVVAVADNGPGISQRDRLRLFEKFYRVDNSGEDQIRGSGLGLALVKSIADRHGGRAWCESGVGRGSIFYLALPVYREAG